MSDPLPLPEIGGVFTRDASGALMPVSDPVPEAAPQALAPEVEPPPAPLKKDRQNG